MKWEGWTLYVGYRSRLQRRNPRSYFKALKGHEFISGSRTDERWLCRSASSEPQFIGKPYKWFIKDISGLLRFCWLYSKTSNVMVLGVAWHFEHVKAFTSQARQWIKKSKRFFKSLKKPIPPEPEQIQAFYVDRAHFRLKYQQLIKALWERDDEMPYRRELISLPALHDVPYKKKSLLWKLLDVIPPLAIIGLASEHRGNPHADRTPDWKKVGSVVDQMLRRGTPSAEIARMLGLCDDLGIPENIRQGIYRRKKKLTSRNAK